MPHRDLFTANHDVDRMMFLIRNRRYVADPADRDEEYVVGQEFLDTLQRRFPGKAWCCGYVTGHPMARFVFYSSNGYMYCLLPNDGDHQGVHVADVMEHRHLRALRIYVYRMTKDEIFFMLGTICDMLSEDTSCLFVSGLIFGLIDLYQSSHVPCRNMRTIQHALAMKKQTIPAQALIAVLARYVCGVFSIPAVVPVSDGAYLVTTQHIFQDRLFDFTERWTVEDRNLVLQEETLRTRASCISFIESITQSSVKHLKNQLPFVFYVESVRVLFFLVKQCGGKLQLIECRDGELFCGQFSAERIERAMGFVSDALKNTTGALYTSWLVYMLFFPTYAFPNLKDILLFKRGDLPLQNLITGLDQIIHDCPEPSVISHGLQSGGYLVRHVQSNGLPGFNEWHAMNNHLLFRFTRYSEIDAQTKDELSAAESVEDANESTDLDYTI
jgi:hypothetical protein